MKILILGRGKSGTTALLFKMAAGLADCQAFSGGYPARHQSLHGNAIFKYTYSERKGKTFELYQQHLAEQPYDRKIWMARDPRDAAVSKMLYRWHKGPKGSWRQFWQHLRLVEQKERQPHSIPFHVLCSYAGHGPWPLATEALIEGERFRSQRMAEFVKNLGDDWFVFTYEDMVRGNFKALNHYLGFEVHLEAEVPQTTKKSKVARKKAFGDWRNWFTPEDVQLFKAAYLPYMEVIGYDCRDWQINPRPVIEPQFASLYMKSLVRKNALNKIRKFCTKIFAGTTHSSRPQQ
ncbi:MAG: sulfotransferase domain-containing protein [Deltaproteobacteria bacterium]|nr:sulfotransferase domain-containing protein [Deltaproteobacteria bacterium]MBW2069629.1 sulfotransferase domain-containing protein [Deltaproteobacteria bacterium]